VTRQQKREERFELFGLIAHESGTPRFLDLVFKEILPKWAKDEGCRFVQVHNNDGTITNMAKIDPYAHQVLSFIGSKFTQRFLSIGDQALYAVQFHNQIEPDKIEIFTGFKEACESVLSDENFDSVSANPFFGLAVAQAIHSIDMEVRFSSLAFRILQIVDPRLASTWLDNRSLSEEARRVIFEDFFHPIRDKSENKSIVKGQHIKVAVLNIIKGPSISNRYFLEDGLLVSFHIGDVGFLFDGRTASYDAVVAPFANFHNGEDLGDICKIAIVPSETSKIMRDGIVNSGFSAILTSHRADLAYEIVRIVKEECIAN